MKFKKNPNKRNFGKRFIAMSMALAMCLTSPGATINIYAEGLNTNLEEDDFEELASEDAHKVVLEESPNGYAYFYDEEKAEITGEDETEYNEGDKVGIKLEADDGYKVKSFAIEDTKGTVLYSTETDDNYFEFTMPKYDVVVKCEFDDDTNGLVISTEGLSFSIVGKKSNANPYAEGMKGFLDGKFGKDIDTITYNSGNKPTASGGGSACASLVRMAFDEGYKTKNGSYSKIAAKKVTGYYLDKNGKEQVCPIDGAGTLPALIIDKDSNWKVAYKFYYDINEKGVQTGKAYDSDGDETKKVILNPGDILIYTPNTYWTPKGCHAQHINFVASVNNDRILIANNNGSGDDIIMLVGGNEYFRYFWGDPDTITITVKPGATDGEYVLEEIDNTDNLIKGEDYVVINKSDYDEIESRTQKGEITNISDIKDCGYVPEFSISTEEGSAAYVTVLRAEEEDKGLTVRKINMDAEACWFSVYENGSPKVTNAQGNKKYAYIVNKYNGGQYSDGYGDLTDAWFTIYTYNSTTKKYEKLPAANLATNPVRAGKSYDLTGVAAGTKLYAQESTAPQGYKKSDEIKELTYNATKKTYSGKIGDSFNPVELFKVYKVDTKGNPVVGAEFTVTDSDGNEWIFKTIADGAGHAVLDLTDPACIVKGKFTLTTDKKKIIWYASANNVYTLKEKSTTTGHLTSGTIVTSDNKEHGFDAGGAIVSWTITSANNGTGNPAVIYTFAKGTPTTYNNIGAGTLIGTMVEDTSLPISISKTDGGTKYNYITKANGEQVVGGSGNDSLSTIASARSSYYGSLDSARFAIYASNAATDTTAISAYANSNYTGATTSLIQKHTYYLKGTRTTPYNKLYVAETTAPAGWKKTDGRTEITTSVGTTATASISNTFSPMSIFTGTKYLGEYGGEGEGGAQFTITDTIGNAWVFESDANGNVDFNKHKDLKTGKVYIGTDGNSIHWFAGDYTLKLTSVQGSMKTGKFCINFNGTVKTYSNISVGSTLLTWGIRSNNGTAGYSYIKAPDGTDATGLSNFGMVDDEAIPLVINKVSDNSTVSTVTCTDGVMTTGTTTLDEIQAKYSGKYDPLSNARFAIHKSQTDTTNIDIYTNDTCSTLATQGSLVPGVTYWVKRDDLKNSINAVTGVSSWYAVETTVPKGWSSPTSHTFDIDWTGKKAAFTLTDKFEGDPFELNITKDGYADNKVNEAKFTVKCNETNEEWVYISKDGYIDFSDPNYLYNGTMVMQGGVLRFFAGTYTLTETDPAEGYLATGNLTVTFKDGSDPKEGTYDGKILEFEVKQEVGADGNTTGETYTDIEIVNITADVDPDNDALRIQEKPKLFGFKMSKVSRETNTNLLMGMMEDYTTVFEVYYAGRYDSDTDDTLVEDDSAAWVDYNLNGEVDAGETVAKGGKVKCRIENADGTYTLSDTWTTDKNGLCASPENYMQIGTYKIVEVTPPTGMIGDSTDNTVRYFPIKAEEKDINEDAKADSEAWQQYDEGAVIDVTENNGPAKNSQRRGGFAGFKYDKSTMRITPLAGSSFAGIEIWVRNDNKNPVYIDEDGDGVGETLLGPGELHKVCTLTDGADKKALYSTNPTYLSYGKYTVFEKQGTNKDYIVDSNYSDEGIQITITDDMDYWLLVRDAEKDMTVAAVNTAQAGAITAIGAHTNNGVARVPDYKTLGDGFSALFANEASRHGVAIIKYDADDYAKAITERNPIWGEYYPEPQGDAVLTGAVYQIINNNGGDITVDTDNDHEGDTVVGANGVCIEITTTWDEDTGLEYALTHHTLLPNGSFIIKEKEASAGYLHNKNDGKAVYEHTYTATEDGQYFIFASSEDAAGRLEGIVNRKFAETHFLYSHVHEIKFVRKLYDKFTDPVKRNGLAIKKNDADRREHLLAKAVNGTVSNDYESKYAQGDATLGGATYKVYNISEHYVYTNPVSETVFTRYETGRKVFEANTGIDVSALSFRDGICTDDLTISDRVAEELNAKLADYACYTLVTDAAGNASTYNNSLPYGTYLVLETKESVGYLNSSKRGGRTFQIVRIRDEHDGTNRVDLTFDLTRLEKSLYEPVIRGGFEFFKYDDDSRENLAQGTANLRGKYDVINRSAAYVWVDTNEDGVYQDSECYAPGEVVFTFYTDRHTGKYKSTGTLLPYGTYEIVETEPPRGYLQSSEVHPALAVFFEVRNEGEIVSSGWYFDENGIRHTTRLHNDPYSNEEVEDDRLIIYNEVKKGKLIIKKNDTEEKEHFFNGVIKTDGDVRNDYESKYAQGDATLGGAVYKIYNISRHYVYTKGTPSGTVKVRYESGRKVFEHITGLDVSELDFTEDINKQYLSGIITDEVADAIREQMGDYMCYTLVTDADGYAATADRALPYGEYIILEDKESTGYLNLAERKGDDKERKGETAKIFRIREDKEVIDLSYDINDLQKSLYELPIRGGFRMFKFDEETKWNIALGSADLNGKFDVINRSKDYVWVDTNENGVYESTECYAPGSVCFSFETDKYTGEYQSTKYLLPYGTYEIHETYPPKGYLHLSNINPDLSVFFEIREDGKIVEDGWFFDKDGNRVNSFKHNDIILDAYDDTGVRIPMGELVGEKKEVTDARLIIYNFVIRGDVFFEKKSAITMQKMAYVPFLMTSYDQDGTPIESHVIFTDQNGDYNSSTHYVDHTYKTNAGDDMYAWLLEYEKAYEEEDAEKLSELDGEYTELMKEYKSGVGTWFGLNTLVSDDLGRKGNLSAGLNETGALPFGYYTIEELRCPVNKGYELVNDSFMIETEAAETDAVTDPEGYRNHFMHGTVNFGTIYNTTKGLKTVALTQDEESHYSYAHADLVIIDTVQYENVVPGHRYRLVAELHDADTGEILFNDWGEEVRVVKEFTPTLSTGSIDMNIEYDAADYKDGGTVVVYEYLYDLTISETDPIMKEEDPNNADQQVHFPEISSLLTGEVSEKHVEKAKEEITLVDVISYKNLQPGQTYVIKGYLIDKDTVDYALDDYGNHIVAEVYDLNDGNISYNKDGNIIVRPEASEGSFRIAYRFDGETLEEKTYVSFVEVSKNRNTIVTHMQIHDKDQTVHFPKISTLAYDKKTEMSLALAESEVTIIDKVTYSNVVPGYEYTLYGVMMNQRTGEVLKDADGNEIKGQTTFTPDTENGSVDVVFTFNATGMEDTTMVAYEELCVNGDYVIAEHKELKDKNQTIHIPKITTKARDSVNATQMVNPDGTISITDTIEYKNVLPDLEYTLKGNLMDLDTNEVMLDGKGNPVTADVTFIAEKADGSIEVKFTFDGFKELEGKTAVVFEELYVITAGGSLDKGDETVPDNDLDLNEDYNGKPDEDDFEQLGWADDEEGEHEDAPKELVMKKVAVETDFKEKEQTIYFPELHTTAFDEITGINVTKAGTAKVIDTVAYYNLMEGYEYTVKGVLMDKATGEALLVNGKEVTASRTFVADKRFGTVDVEFEFDASEIAGRTVVIFETLYYKEYVLNAHEDIDDGYETFYIPYVGTTLTDSETEDHIANPDSEVILTDKVAYTNLLVGHEYIMVGRLINKNTKKAIKLVNGEKERFDSSELEHPYAVTIIQSGYIFI